MQADFTVIRRGRESLLAFVATLGFSRASWVRFTEGDDPETLVISDLSGFVRFAVRAGLVSPDS